MSSRPPYPGEDPSRRQSPGPGPYPPEYHQPPPYGGYAQSGYSPPPRKKAKWPWILGAIVVALLLLGGACIAFTAGVGNEIEKQISEEVTISYEVTSDGPLAGTISYSSGDAGDIEQATQQPLPWTTDVTLTGLVKSFSLTAQADQAATTISCTVREGERILAEQTSTGPYAVVSCSGDAG